MYCTSILCCSCRTQVPHSHEADCHLCHRATLKRLLTLRNISLNIETECDGKESSALLKRKGGPGVGQRERERERMAGTENIASERFAEGGEEEGEDGEEVENVLGNMLADLCAIPGTCAKALQVLGLWKPTEDLVEMWNDVRSSSLSLDQIQKGRSRGASSPSL